MVESSTTSVEQLESMLREGRISNEEYKRLRNAMTPQRAEKRETPAKGRPRKSWTDRELGGVCGGIARHFDVSSTRIRLAFLILLLFTGGTAMAVYLALYLVLPWDEDERDRIPTFPWKFAAAVFVLCLALLALLQVVVPRVMNLSENVGTRLPAPVLALFNLSDRVGDVGMIAFPIGVLILVGLGAALSRHERAYAVFTKIVIGVLVVILTLQALILAMFLLTVA